MIDCQSLGPPVLLLFGDVQAFICVCACVCVSLTQEDICPLKHTRCPLCRGAPQSAGETLNTAMHHSHCTPTQRQREGVKEECDKEVEKDRDKHDGYRRREEEGWKGRERWQRVKEERWRCR